MDIKKIFSFLVIVFFCGILNAQNFTRPNDWKKYQNKRNYIILRHDVDFDTSLALEMAQLEKKYKVRSNYFFLMRDDFYDLYSIKTTNDIKSIFDLGHNIGLHINPASYNFFTNPKKKLRRDIEYFTVATIFNDILLKLFYQFSFFIIFQCSIVNWCRVSLINHFFFFKRRKNWVKSFKIIKIFKNCTSNIVNHIVRNFFRSN